MSRTEIDISDRKEAEFLIEEQSKPPHGSLDAIQLLGAQVVLTGVRPEVATILVGLDIDWKNIVMRGTLQAGIAYATRAELARRGAAR